MAQPHGFTWIEKPLLAGMGRPDSLEELTWLRRQGIELLISLTEDRLRRDWVDDAGLLVFHEPVEDMQAPLQEQIDRCISAIVRAHGRKMGVGVHCGAGMGRTGVILACWFVHQGMSARDAIATVRKLRPGSIETEEQSDAVAEYSRRRKGLVS